MAAETSSPAREPPTAATRGRGRGGRGGRGRGRGGGRGASNAAMSKSTTVTRGRGGTRRGRVKNFSDSRVQAAYERQRDLKATYQAVALALKPALQELAERNVDEMLQKPDSYKQVDEYLPIVEQIQDKLDAKLAECARRLSCDLNLAENTFTAENYVTEKEFQVCLPQIQIGFNIFFGPCVAFSNIRTNAQNAVSDVLEQFYESQENRLRILSALQAKDLPIDVSFPAWSLRPAIDPVFFSLLLLFIFLFLSPAL